MRAELAEHLLGRGPAAEGFSCLNSSIASSSVTSKTCASDSERSELVAALDVRPEAAEVGDDLLAGLRVEADQPRQREQLERSLERERTIRCRPRASDARRGFSLLPFSGVSPSCTYGPNRPVITYTGSPRSGRSPEAAGPLVARLDERDRLVQREVGGWRRRPESTR